MGEKLDPRKCVLSPSLSLFLPRSLELFQRLSIMLGPPIGLPPPRFAFPLDAGRKIAEAIRLLKNCHPNFFLM